MVRSTTGDRPLTPGPVFVVAVSSVIFFALAVFAIVTGTERGFAPLWYANGLAVIALLLLQRTYWPAEFAAIAAVNFLANIACGFGVAESLAFGTGNLLEIGIAATWLSAQANPSALLDSPLGLTRLLVQSITLPALAGTATGSILLYLLAGLPVSASLPTGLIGNMLGALVILPLGLITLQRHFAGGSAGIHQPDHPVSDVDFGWAPKSAIFVVTIVLVILAAVYVDTPFIWISAFITLASVPLGLRLTSIMSLLVTEVFVHLLAAERFGEFGNTPPQDDVILLRLSLLVTLLFPLYVSVFRRWRASVLSSYQNMLAEVEAANEKLTARGREIDSERARFRRLFNDSPEAYFVIAARERVIVDCNKAAERMLRATREQIIGQSPKLFEADKQPDGQSNVQTIDDTLRRMEAHGFAEVDMLRRRLDGSEFWISGSVTRSYFNDEPNNLWVWRDISDRKKLETDLELARTRAEAANLAKSQFLAAMNHEIRTPLNVIVNSVHLLSQEDQRQPGRRDLSAVEAAAANLLTIVNDVLDFSKIEAGELTLDHRPFSLREVIADVAGLFSTQARAKNIDLLLPRNLQQLPDSLVGDASRLRQMIYNLVANAIKFTDHGQVRIGVASLGPEGKDGAMRVRFEVSDSGIGISADKLDRLFKPFSQADLSTTRQYGGTGLGLSLVKRLAGMMGGTTGVDSEVGKGSRFWFDVVLLREDAGGESKVMPRAGDVLRLGYLCSNGHAEAAFRTACGVFGWQVRMVTDAQEARRALGDGGGDASIDCLVTSGVPAPGMPGAVVVRQPDLASATAAPELFDALNAAFFAAGRGPSYLLDRSEAHAGSLSWLAGSTIMLVDDSAMNVEVLAMILRQFGADVLECLSGAEAVDAMRTSPRAVDAILMDLQMPDMDGCAATVIIRDISGAEGVPVIALTAGATTTERERALASGMSDFATKPMKPLALMRIVRKHIERYRGRPLRFFPAR